jgi:hypothetical protein
VFAIFCICAFVCWRNKRICVEVRLVEIEGIFKAHGLR